MRVRHRVPTVFSLSMLDVFCCALGCVILLWLWNERLSKARAKTADETRQLLESARTDLADARRLIDSLKADLTGARGSIASLTTDRDQARQALGAAEKSMAGLRSDLASAKERETNLANQRDQTQKDLAAARADAAKVRTRADLLAKKAREQEETAADLESLLEKKRKDEDALKVRAAKAQQRIEDLEVLLRDRDKELTVVSAKVKDLTDRLHDADGRITMLRSKAETASSLQTSIDESARKLAAADARIAELEKFLSNRKSIMVDMQGRLDDLQTERKKLTDELAKSRVAADNRFAGIQLTGRRAIFLVDMSGSMKMTDPNTYVPEKWTIVADTVVKVMKSLPDLEKYQLIVFSENASFPLGSDSDWLDFNASTSPGQVKQVLSKIEPKGNTNMYSPFELAFRLRPRGLDTIYLFSDGLPNIGPGLTPAEQAKNLSEAELGDILGRYIRKMLREQWNRPASGWAKVRINSVGFFYESPDVGAFLWALSREFDGSFVGMSKP
jgi:predicted  nucleic acid-binding Zn-ribbon protein